MGRTKALFMHEKTVDVTGLGGSLFRFRFLRNEENQKVVAHAH